jgi:hypothetical protein
VHKLPADLREALIDNPTALDAWKDITPLARNEFICWVEDAKQEMTRERRIRAGPRRSWRKANVGPAAGQGASTASAPADSSRLLEPSHNDGIESACCFLAQPCKKTWDAARTNVVDLCPLWHNGDSGHLPVHQPDVRLNSP